MAEKLNGRFVRKDDPKELIDLCTQCEMLNCDGTPCDAYRAMERRLKAERKVRKPAMMIEQLAPCVSELIERASGLRLMNLALDALLCLAGEEAIKEDDSMLAELNDVISKLDMKRYILYSYRVDWHELEKPDERGDCA